MNDFAARLEEASSALQKLNYQPLEEFPALAVQVARRTALAMIQEMLGHLRSESSEAEIMAAVPFTLAFVANVIVYCNNQSSTDLTTTSRMMDTAARIARNLGDGVAEHFSTGESVAKSNWETNH